MRYSLLMIVLSVIVFANCTLIKEQLSGRDDATVAYKLNNPHIQTFRFPDLKALKFLLTQRLDNYKIGVSYLKKVALKYEGMDRTPHEKRVINLERRINVLDARIGNLLLIYPDDWMSARKEIDEEFKELVDLYRQTYDKLF